LCEKKKKPEQYIRQKQAERKEEKKKTVDHHSLELCQHCTVMQMNSTLTTENLQSSGLISKVY
jgi:hypothetical protein